MFNAWDFARENLGKINNYNIAYVIFSRISGAYQTISQLSAEKMRSDDVKEAIRLYHFYREKIDKLQLKIKFFKEDKPIMPVAK